MQRRTAIISTAATLVGCAATSNAPDGKKLAATQGILAVLLSANATGNIFFVPYGRSPLGTILAEELLGVKGALRFIQGERYLVVALEAGEYMWSKLYANNKVASLYSTTRFRVRAGSITYIGHIHLAIINNVLTMKAFDREEDMLGHLKINFPSYSEIMPFEKALAEFRL